MATLTVTNANDDGAGSLRAAVAAANALAGDDEIVFDAAVFDGGSEDRIRLTSGQIAVTDGLTLTGGPAGVTITGDAAGDDVTDAAGITDMAASFGDNEDLMVNNSRIFDATAALTIDGLTLTGGFVDGESGGAIRSTAAVTLMRSVISGNRTGYLYSEPTLGGGVYSSDRITANASFISGNHSGSSGGGLSAHRLEVTNSDIGSNRAFGAGGGLHGVEISVADSRIFGNQAQSYGGGIWAVEGASVLRSVVSGNHSDSGGGGVDATDVHVADSVVSGNFGGYIGGGGLHGWNITVLRSAISDNGANAHGAGIYSEVDVTLENSTVSGNILRATYGLANGGGVFAKGEVVGRQSTVTGNGVDLEFAYQADTGGIQAGSVRLENSIVTGNAVGELADEVGGTLFLSGGNILGPERLQGAQVLGAVTAQQVFAATTEIAPGVFAGVLADNGGRTPTIAIRADGPAAGAADPALALPEDQRGFARDDAPDLGAFEAGASGGLTLVGGPTADRLMGGAGDDQISGLAGNDRLRGLGGEDLLAGGRGCDRLKGGTGDDILHGGTGADRMGSGRGEDLLCGGRGADIFRFGAEFGADVIADFDACPAGGQDRIDLRRLGVTVAGFDQSVTIEREGEGTLVTVAGYGTIFCRGVYGGVYRTDFLLA